MSGTPFETFTTGQVLTAPELTAIVNAIQALAPINNPTFTGSVIVPNLQAGTNSEQATNASFVQQAIAAAVAPLLSSNGGTGGALTLAELTALGAAPANNPTLTGLIALLGAVRQNVTIFDAATGSFAGQQNYTVSTTDTIVIVKKVTGAPTRVTLPPAVATSGRILTVVDGKGDAAINPITVVPSGTNYINSSTSLIVSSAFGGNKFVDNGSGWTVIGTI